jgi:hypothetical protein
VALLLASILVYIKALQTESSVYFALSGLLLGISLLTRTVAQMIWIILFLSAIMHYYLEGSVRLKVLVVKLRGPMIAAAITILMAVGWMTHNSLSLGYSNLSRSMPEGLGKVVCLTRAHINEKSYNDELKLFGKMIEDSVAITGEFHVTKSRISRRLFIETLMNSPLSLAQALGSNVNSQMHIDFTILGFVLPEWKSEINKSFSEAGKWRYFHVLTILALAGSILMYLRGNREASVLLFLIMAYFAVLSGFTVWQTRRIYFPAQIATTILISTVLVTGFDWARSMVARIRTGQLSSMIRSKF